MIDTGDIIIIIFAYDFRTRNFSPPFFFFFIIRCRKLDESSGIITGWQLDERSGRVVKRHEEHPL